jgi:hypothetical protein
VFGGQPFDAGRPIVQSRCLSSRDMLDSQSSELPRADPRAGTHLNRMRRPHLALRVIVVATLALPPVQAVVWYEIRCNDAADPGWEDDVPTNTDECCIWSGDNAGASMLR